MVLEELIYIWSGGNIAEENILSPTFCTALQLLVYLGRLLMELDI